MGRVVTAGKGRRDPDASALHKADELSSVAFHSLAAQNMRSAPKYEQLLSLFNESHGSGPPAFDRRESRVAKPSHESRRPGSVAGLPRG